jgi:hypothetical protein
MVTANKKTYAVKLIGTSSNTVLLTNIANRYTNEGLAESYQGTFKGKIYSEMIGTKINEDKMKAILREEIGANNISILSKDYRNFISAYITFSIDGKVLEVSFSTTNNTLVDSKMIERIETRIKKEIYATFNETIRPGFTKPFYQDFKFIRYDAYYYFNKLVIN